MLELIFLIFGIAGLGVGAELVTRGALNIGQHFKISQIFMGLTVLALGSDLPELVVNIGGAIKQLGGIETSGIIVGDVIGSCFGQIGLILGIVGLFGVLTLTKKQLLRDGLTMVSSVVILFLVSFNGSITRAEGIILILIYILYLITLYREERVHEKIPRAPRLHLLWSVISLLGGFVLLIYSSNLTLDNAIFLSEKWGIAQSIVGILLVGVGTSLPELAIAISAVRKNASGMAIGNLIGSNIFDALVPIGVAAIITQLNISVYIRFFDLPMLFLLSLIVLYLFGLKKLRLRKRGALLLLVIFAAYAALKVTIVHTV